MKGLNLKFYCIISLFLTTNALATPQDVPTQLYELLRPKLEWLDINYKPSKPYDLVIRYFPCFPAVAIMDMLIRQALAEGIPYCTLQNPGIPQKEQGYCLLNKVKLKCSAS